MGTNVQVKLVEICERSVKCTTYSCHLFVNSLSVPQICEKQFRLLSKLFSDQHRRPCRFRK